MTDYTPLIETIEKFLVTDGYTVRVLHARAIRDHVIRLDLIGDPILSSHVQYLLDSLTGKVMSSWQRQDQAAKEMLNRARGYVVAEELLATHNDDGTTSYGSFQ